MAGSRSVSTLISRVVELRSVGIVAATQRTQAATWHVISMTATRLSAHAGDDFSYEEYVAADAYVESGLVCT